MSSPSVRQLTALAELFKYALDRCLPESVAVLGVAGGNGLEQIDRAITKRIAGVDINRRYLDKVQRRFGALPGLELHCCDLAGWDFSLTPMALVHAALIFEHVGLGRALENALSAVAPGGRLSVVLQLPSEVEQGVAPTAFTSMQTLKRDFALIDRNELQALLGKRDSTSWSGKPDPYPRERDFGLASSPNAALPIHWARDLSGSCSIWPSLKPPRLG